MDVTTQTSKKGLDWTLILLFQKMAMQRIQLVDYWKLQ